MIIRLVERFGEMAMRHLNRKGDDVRDVEEQYKQWLSAMEAATASVDDKTSDVFVAAVVLDNVLRKMLNPRIQKPPSLPEDNVEQKLRIAKEVQRIKSFVPKLTTVRPIQVQYTPFDPRPRRASDTLESHCTKINPTSKVDDSTVVFVNGDKFAQTCHELVHSLKEQAFQDRKFLLECRRHPEGMQAEEMRMYQARSHICNIPEKFSGPRYGERWETPSHGISLHQRVELHATNVKTVSTVKRPHSAQPKACSPPVTPERHVGKAGKGQSFASHVNAVRQKKHALLSEATSGAEDTSENSYVRSSTAVSWCNTSVASQKDV